MTDSAELTEPHSNEQYANEDNTDFIDDNDYLYDDTIIDDTTNVIINDNINDSLTIWDKIIPWAMVTLVVANFSTPFIISLIV